MPIAKIALIGSSGFLRSTLYNLFMDSNFEVEHMNLGPEDLEGLDVSRYDLVVIPSDFSSAGGEKQFFDFLLSTKGFLLLDDGQHSAPQYINPKMSLEEILSKVGNVIFAYKTTMGIPARTSPMILVNLDVLYTCKSMVYRSTLSNLSNNGAFITTLNPLPEGSRVKLHFSLPNEGASISASGRVLYGIEFNLDAGIISRRGAEDKKVIATPGMAVLFEEMSDEHREAVRLFVRERSL